MFLFSLLVIKDIKFKQAESDSNKKYEENWNVFLANMKSKGEIFNSFFFFLYHQPMHILTLSGYFRCVFDVKIKLIIIIIIIDTSSMETTFTFETSENKNWDTLLLKNSLNFVLCSLIIIKHRLHVCLQITDDALLAGVQVEDEGGGDHGEGGVDAPGNHHQVVYAGAGVAPQVLAQVLPLLPLPGLDRVHLSRQSFHQYE